MKILVLLLLLLATTLSLTAETVPLTLRSVIKLGDHYVFSVVSPETGRSAWVSVGDSFEGSRVVSFSASEDVLIVQKDDEEHRISLAPASAARPRPEISLYTTADELLAWIEGQPIRTQFERVATYMALSWKALVDGVEQAQSEAEILAVLRQHEQVLAVLEGIMPSIDEAVAREATARQTDLENVQRIFAEVVAPHEVLHEPYMAVRSTLLSGELGSEVRSAAERVFNRNRR